ncbi:MAG: hypothetical protein IJU33_05075 [Bacteroidales bacterium]|nr:hypothetical protein [Bacteroidales bacterium]
MLELICKLDIGHKDNKKTYSFDYVANAEVVTSCNNLTDTAKITLPRNLRFKGESITEYISKGDSVKLQLGYRENGKEEIKTVFNGYINTVSTGTPIVLECENEMYLLKKKTVKDLYFANFKVSEFFKAHVPEIEYEVVGDDTGFGEVRISGEVTVASVLNYLESHYPVKFFFRGGKLYGVLNYSTLGSEKGFVPVKFRWGWNIISDTLKYTRAEDVKVAVCCKALLKDNKSLVAYAPKNYENEKKEYELRTFYVQATSQAELQDEAERRQKEFKCDKMEGDFTAFGYPHVEKGDLVLIRDEDHPERDNMKFVADAVTYTFGKDGYRQKIKLGKRIK